MSNQLPADTLIHVQPQDFNRGYELYLKYRRGDTIVTLQASEIALERDECTPPLAALSKPTAQALMDSLWQAGIRPAEGSGSAGSLAATERHLEDMRALAFKAIKAVKP